MYSYFESQINIFKSIVSDAELRLNLISQIRLLLQQIDYSLLEWISKKRPTSEYQPTKEIIDSLRQPADGALVDALDALLISCDQLGWSGSSRALLKPIHSDSSAMDLISQHSPNLLGLLRTLVELRNQGAEGHGLPGGGIGEMQKYRRMNLLLASSLNFYLS